MTDSHPTKLIAIAAVTAVVGCTGSRYREVEVDLTGAEPEPSAHRADDHPTLRVSVAAMQSPRNTYAAYSRLFSRVGELLGASTVLVQRRTYGEVNDLLMAGQLNVALVCPGGYLDLRRREPGIEILAVPVIRGRTTYESVIIVPSRSSANSLKDLRGKRFAYTDELSLSGRAFVIYKLRSAQEDPAKFFSGWIFTHSHDKSIEAVESGLVDGAAVDSLVYEATLAQRHGTPAKSRVIARSAPLGMMPVVAGPAMPAEMRAQTREILLGLDRDPASAAALHSTGIERFEVPAPGLYESAETIMAACP